LQTFDFGPDQPLITFEQLVYLHTVAIVEFGGREGVRDGGLLEAALARPLTGFGGESLYATPFARAAALFEGLIRNHGFVDGNKRVAVLAAAFWLEREGYTLTATQDDLVQVTLAVVKHRLSLDALAGWLETNSVPM
jgi:death-on-curing protein